MHGRREQRGGRKRETGEGEGMGNEAKVLGASEDISSLMLIESRKFARVTIRGATACRSLACNF